MTWGTDETDGWGAGIDKSSIPIATAELRGATPDDWGTASGSGWAQKSQSEDDSGWLNSGGSQTSPSVTSENLVAGTTWPESEDDWIDEEPSLDDDEPMARNRSAPTSSAGFSGLAILFALVLGLGLGLGWLWLHPMKSSSEVDADKLQVQTQASTQALDLGRRTVVDAKQSLQRKDFEMAAAQLKSAVAKLTDGKAPIAEVQEAKRLYARSLFADKKFVEARSVWKELSHESGSGRQEAQKNVGLANQELRKLANQNLMAAEADLKSGRYREAEGLARMALQSYERYGGDTAHLGMANGALGYAQLERGLREPALRHLRAANSYYPEGGYRIALRRLGAADTVEVSPQPSLLSQPLQPQGPATLDPNYPQGGNAGVHQPAPVEPSLPVTQPEPQASNPQNTYRPPPPKPKPVRRDDGYINYQDRSQR